MRSLTALVDFELNLELDPPCLSRAYSAYGRNKRVRKEEPVQSSRSTSSNTGNRN